MPRPFDLLPPLIPAVLVTLQITAGAAVLAAVLAFAAGLGSLSRDRIVHALSRIYIEIFRGTSALVQLFWFYFALPLIGISLNAKLAGIMVLGLNIGAYGAEVVRGAIVAVPRGQHEAGLTLSLSRFQIMRHIILPQAIVAMFPPFGNLLIELLKSTALVSLITITDLTRAALFLRDETLRTPEIFGLVLMIYFLISMVMTFGFRWLERRAGRGVYSGGGR